MTMRLLVKILLKIVKICKQHRYSININDREYLLRYKDACNWL